MIKLPISVLNKYVTLLVVIIPLFIQCTSPLGEDSVEYNGISKGFNVFITTSRNCFIHERYNSHMANLKSLGVNAIYLITFHFVVDETSSEIIATNETISDSILECAIKCTQDNDIEVVLKPHINILNGKPRYMLSPKSKSTFTNAYFKILRQYAQLSIKYNLKQFVIGTELDNIVDHHSFYSKIQEVRNIYHGRLIYSSSFDHFINTDIWKYVDIIGVNGYFNLCKKNTCCLSEMVESWNYWLNIIDQYSIMNNKPFVLTEVGYYSRLGCSINPGDWTQINEVDFNEQAKSYEALLCQAGLFKNLEGIFWWQWELNNAWGNNDADYTPENKPAEAVIRKYWSNEN